MTADSDHQERRLIESSRYFVLDLFAYVHLTGNQLYYQPLFQYYCEPGVFNYYCCSESYLFLIFARVLNKFLNCERFQGYFVGDRNQFGPFTVRSAFSKFTAPAHSKFVKFLLNYCFISNFNSLIALFISSIDVYLLKLNRIDPNAISLSIAMFFRTCEGSFISEEHAEPVERTVS